MERQVWGQDACMLGQAGQADEQLSPVLDQSVVSQEYWPYPNEKAGC